MTTATLQLSVPTSQTVVGPKLRTEGDRLFVEYDCELDDGKIIWSEVVFDEVLAFEYRQAMCSQAEDVAGSKEIRCLTDSGYLAAVLRRWQESVGWQKWQQDRGGIGRFKHFKIFF